MLSYDSSKTFRNDSITSPQGGALVVFALNQVNEQLLKVTRVIL